jgi:hypothetical protein
MLNRINSSCVVRDTMLISRQTPELHMQLTVKREWNAVVLLFFSSLVKTGVVILLRS